MTVITSSINTRADNFKINSDKMNALLNDLRDKVQQIAQGGDEKARKRHTDQGKLLPRDRITTFTGSRHSFFGIIAICRL